MKKFILRILMVLLSFLSISSTIACDGMTASVLSNVYMGNNQYQVTVQYCESVSNGAGAAVSGIILQTSGAGTIVGTTTPTFTSISTGVVINYNQINGNTVQWGEWDDNPNVADFLQNGNATQCFTMILNTNGPITSVNISGSSASSNLGAGFTSWFGRWCCKMTLTVPPVTCNSTWTPPQICPGSAPINLNSTSSLTGVFSGSGVNSATGIFTPSSTTLPAAVTFTVGDAGLNCSTTLNITSPYSIAPINDVTICAGQSVNLVAAATASLPCNYVLNLQDSYGDGWQGGANVSVYINGVLYGNYTLASGSTQNINIPVSTGSVITLNYTAGSSWNSENRVRILNPSGTAIFTSAWGPASGSMGGGITANCGVNTAYTYSWTPTTGLSNAAIANPIATPATTTTYTVSATSSTGCVLTEPVTITVTPGGNPTFNILSPACQNTVAPVLPTISTNGISGTWNPTNISTVVAGSTTYTFTPSGGGCSTPYSFNFVVNPIPVVNAGLDQSICAGSAVTLAATGATTYSWNNSVTQGISFTPAATATYIVTGTGVGGCTNTDQVIVTVNPIPITNAGLDAAICFGQFVNLTASGATSYSWSPGGQTTSVISVSPAITTVYTVIGTSLGCTSSDAVTVSVSGNAAINAGLDVTICVGQNTTLLATGGTIYTWDNGLGSGSTFSVAPLTTTVYTVIGTNSGGCVGTDAVTITVNPIPIVNAGPDAGICNSGSTTLTASGATNYVWSPGGQTTNSIIVSPSSTTTYTVSGTTLGCSANDDVVVSVSPNAIINAGQDVSICIGNSVTLTATGGVNYTWDNSLGIGNNFTISPIVTTTYSVTGTTAGGCIGSDFITITVNPIPIVNAGIDQTICIGASVTLAGAGASAYTWDNGISNGIAFTPAVGTTTYTVTGTSAAGCVNTDQVDVIVNPLPIVNAGIDQAVCAGTAVTLSASGANTYTWNNGVTDGVAFTPLATTPYTVTGTSVAGCINTDQVVVTVNPIPTVNAGNDIVICAGATVTLTGSGANTYTWDNGVTNAVAFTPAVGTITYTVTGSTAFGCFNTDQVVVTVNPIPAISFTPDVTIGCIPLTVNFTNTTVGSTNCVWTMSDGTVLNGCGTVANTFTMAGCYDITLTAAAAGCTNSFTAIDLVCAEAPPVASFNPSSSVISELNPIVDFNNTTIGATTYLWNFGDNTPTSTTVNPTHDYSADDFGFYTVTLIAYSPLGCVDTATSVIQIVEELIFYVPNTFTPDEDNYNPVFKPIFTSGFDPYDYNLLIFNRWGEIVFESHNSEIGWNGTYGSNGEIELVQDGTYTWKIEFKVTKNDERKMVVGHVNIIR